ncbi:MAG: DUF484 family protein [Acidisphaera sp.]|nr:DUF484 family protein [Acidisphaera sp.]
MEPAEVTAFLRANPSWLADNPDLYRMLAPPIRLHGDRLADHMAAMLRAERAAAAQVVSAGRAAAGLAARVQEAVLALMRADDPEECVAAEFAGLLAVDAASLCLERHRRGARLLPRGLVGCLLGGRDVVFRETPDDAPLLHAEAAMLARHDALVRVPLAGEPALLALVARDRRVLEPGQGTAALAFLGRAVAAALERDRPNRTRPRA